MKFFILILQFLFFISVNANKKASEGVNKTPSRTYPSNWTVSPFNYYINTSSGLDPKPIKEALEKIQKQSCFRFNPMNDTNFDNTTEGFYFFNSSRCATTLGNVNRTRLHDIEIGGMCNKPTDVGKIQQLIGKALGMVDQHRRPDRDNYITINYTDLIFNRTLADHYLEKWNSSMMHLYGIGYDYSSLFHWKSNVLRRPNDSTPTLNAKISEYNKMMGQTVEFNFGDYKLLNYHFCNDSYVKMYGEMPNCTNNGYYDINSGQNGTCKCPNGFSGQLCDKLRDSDSSCTNKTDNIATSSNQTLSISGIKNCTYRIKTSNGNNVLVTILDVKTQMPTEGQKCMPETGFEIKHRNDKSPAGLCLCGNYSGITLTSEGNEVIVLYTGKSNDDSFNLTYYEVNHEKNKLR
uniref:Metalloendopeptidase n=1 Tax=Strongyloides papillosus TaxID=174720 RepID=A0A0N5B5X6_STREA